MNVSFFTKTPFCLKEIGNTNKFCKLCKHNFLPYIINKIGINKVTKLLQLSDPNVINIYKKGAKYFLNIKNTSVEISFSNLSSGTRRFLYLIVEILFNKKMGIYMFDELEFNFHRELSLALIKLMNMKVAQDKNKLFIFTTHNPLILGDYISNKQIYSLDIDDETGVHHAKRLSSNLNLKSHQKNIAKKYMDGLITPYPSKSLIFDYLYEVLNDLDN